MVSSFCSEAGIIVTNYTDEATGTMVETASGSGHFTKVTLHPTVTVAEESMIKKQNNFIIRPANSASLPTPLTFR